MTQENNKCDVCGKSVMVGVTAVIEVATVLKSEDCKDKETIIKLLKNYLKPYKLDKRYCVCYPCWLKSMGIKP